MKKYAFLAVIVTMVLSIVSCISSYTPSTTLVSGGNQDVSGANTNQPATVKTSTPVPTSTIDYQTTAVIAQQTSDEARRVNAQITAEFEQRVQSQLQMTADAEKRNQEIYSWTATAALTSVPLTATQQIINNTLTVKQQSLQSGILTATWGAPTQAKALINVEQEKRFASAKNVSGIVGSWALVAFMISIIIFMFRFPVSRINNSMQPESNNQTETVLWIDKKDSQGFGGRKRYAVPCSPDQLTELGEMVVNGERTFAINRIESDSRTLRNKRNVIYEFRNFLVGNDLAFHPKPGDGDIALNDAGVEFLVAWFENHQLPEQYNFGEDEENGKQE